MSLPGDHRPSSAYQQQVGSRSGRVRSNTARSRGRRPLGLHRARPSIHITHFSPPTPAVSDSTSDFGSLDRDRKNHGYTL